MLVRVLRREHEERRRQRPGRAVDGDLPLRHGFQEAALGAWRRPVDLVGEDEVREQRTRFEDELSTALLVDGDTRDVAREQIARELDAREGEIEGTRERMGERRLAYARDVLEEQVTVCGQRGEGQLDDLGLAPQGAGDVRLQGTR